MDAAASHLYEIATADWFVHIKLRLLQCREELLTRRANAINMATKKWSITISRSAVLSGMSDEM